MKSWLECKPTTYQGQIEIETNVQKSLVWDKKFLEIDLSKVEQPFRDIILSIKYQYEKRGMMSKKQAIIISRNWTFQNVKKRKSYGPTFKGLPRVMYE